MDLNDINGYTLRGIDRINIVLGKNGCGKSTMLRQVETGLSARPAGKTKYITPERGGSLVYEAGIEQSLANDHNWLPGQRRRNQDKSFRQQSVAQYRKLETLVLREIERGRRGDADYTFDIYVGKINSLLDNIEIRRQDSTFKIYRKGTEEELSADRISSGESELISLGIECLIFSKEMEVGQENFLILDEPDVHLHPDLQVRFMHFLRDLVTENNGLNVLIATHSTAILGALESYMNTQLAFLSSGQRDIAFKAISESYRKILPVFGAHPLSNVFNQAPILLVEGEDDERIWQRVVRTSAGAIKVYPCAVEGVGNLGDIEEEARTVIQTVYDNAKGFSLRDRDGTLGEIDDLAPLIRLKLACRNAENLLLSDEVLESLRTTWLELHPKIEEWIENNPTHPHYDVMCAFRDSDYDRMSFDTKDIRNDLMGIIGSSKPWEVAVGQVIAGLNWVDATDFTLPDKICTYLGEKLVKNLLPKI